MRTHWSVGWRVQRWLKQQPRVRQQLSLKRDERGKESETHLKNWEDGKESKGILMTNKRENDTYSSGYYGWSIVWDYCWGDDWCWKIWGEDPNCLHREKYQESKDSSEGVSLKQEKILMQSAYFQLEVKGLHDCCWILHPLLLRLLACEPLYSDPLLR